MNSLTMVGSVRDACAPVQSVANSVQFEGTSTFNGSRATFRVCAQDNSAAGAPHQLNVQCTAGCSYSSGGNVATGLIQVKQN